MFIFQLMHNATGDEFYYILRGLSPYSEHTVLVQACNSVGCVNSTTSIGRTQQAGMLALITFFCLFLEKIRLDIFM